jgi:hypothetical protein
MTEGFEQYGIPSQAGDVARRIQLVKENPLLNQDCATRMIARFCNTKCRKRDETCPDCKVAELSMFVGGTEFLARR